MELHIDKKGEIPVRQQLTEQIIFSIASQKLKPGEALPSVRELARRLKIHRNTVSQAYRELKRRAWLAGARGGRVVVLAGGQLEPDNSVDLDDLINATIRAARDQGYTLRALRERVTARLLAQPPDRLLVVEQEPALRALLEREIGAAIDKPVEGCTLADLANDPELAIGALTVVAHYAVREVDALLPKDMPAIPLAFSAAEEQLELLRNLRHPSIVAVVSISAVFRNTAAALLASAAGQRHTVREFAFPFESSAVIKAADLVFADSIVCRKLKHTRIIQYNLINPNSLEYLVSAMKSYDQPQKLSGRIVSRNGDNSR
jgi:DNA-binding transcriptional regulator YhcF (GntR family)